MSNLYYAEQGSGELVLFLHGISSSSRTFAAQLDELAVTHHVLAWDAPGYGRSADPQAAPGLAGYAAAATELIDRYGGRAHLVGSSWGGVIACQLAHDRPDAVRSLILMSASRGSGRSIESAAAMRARADELDRAGIEKFARERVARLVSETADDALRADVVATIVDAVRLPGYGFAAEAMADTDLTPILGEIDVPTLVLCGDEDTVTGPEESRALAAGIPDAVYVSVRGAGHLVNVERPQAVNAWIASYLQIIERLNS